MPVISAMGSQGEPEVEGENETAVVTAFGLVMSNCKLAANYSRGLSGVGGSARKQLSIKGLSRLRCLFASIASGLVSGRAVVVVVVAAAAAAVAAAHVEAAASCLAGPSSS